MSATETTHENSQELHPDMHDKNAEQAASDTDTPTLDEEKARSPDTSSSDALASSSPRDMSTLSWILVLLSIYISAILYGLDTTVVADVQGTVLQKFGEPEKLAWIGVGFPLGSIAIILSIGKAFGVFSMKWLYFGCLVFFEIGSAVCGAAPDMNALIIGRVIAGAGGAGIYLGALNILSTLTSDRERPIYIAGLGATWGLGTILGPVVGGAFAESSATWRWAFYINLVLFGVCFPVYIFMIPSLDPQPDRKFIDKLAQMDWVGAVLNAAIYTTWVLALTFGGAEWAWSDGRTIACFVVCGVLIILFALQQTYTIFTDTTRRIFPVGFMSSRTLVLQYFVTACTATSLFVPIYYIPIFFQFTRNDSAITAAVRLLPFIILLIVCILLNGALMPKIGYYQPFHLASGILITIGGALMYTVHDSTSPAKVYGYSILMGIGTGLSSQASYSVAPVKVATDPRYGPSMIPDGIGFINMAQVGSIVHALAISGTVFQNLAFQNLKDALAGLGFSDAQLHGAISGAQSQILETASEEVKRLAVGAIVQAMDRVYILVIVAGAGCLVASLLMKTEKLFMKAAAGGA